MWNLLVCSSVWARVNGTVPEKDGTRRGGIPHLTGLTTGLITSAQGDDDQDLGDENVL